MGILFNHPNHSLLINDPSLAQPLVNHLLDLLPQLRQFPLPPLLRSLRPTLSIQHVIPPPKATCIIPNKPFMMNIVMVGPSPKRQEMMQRPGKLITTMCVNGLKQPAQDP